MKLILIPVEFGSRLMGTARQGVILTNPLGVDNGPSFIKTFKMIEIEAADFEKKMAELYPTKEAMVSPRIYSKTTADNDKFLHVLIPQLKRMRETGWKLFDGTNEYFGHPEGSVFEVDLKKREAQNN